MVFIVAPLLQIYDLPYGIDTPERRGQVILGPGSESNPCLVHRLYSRPSRESTGAKENYPVADICTLILSSEYILNEIADILHDVKPRLPARCKTGVDILAQGNHVGYPLENLPYPYIGNIGMLGCVIDDHYLLLHRCSAPEEIDFDLRFHDYPPLVDSSMLQGPVAGLLCHQA